MTRSHRRAATGTHYTPRSLAEEVAEGALQPLVYRPGPLETSDTSQWRIRPSKQILELKVADIAMGSGAFLVAACRYLADRLIEAWLDEGDAEALAMDLHRTAGRVGADAEADQLLLKARREITEHCLYGVDINPLAVEMAKLSLWLITMDTERPFGFLDDRLAAGDSLLGLVSLEQLESLHVDAKEGRRLHHGTLDFASEWRDKLAQAADLRRKITATGGVTIRDIEHKARLTRPGGETVRRDHDGRRRDHGGRPREREAEGQETRRRRSSACTSPSATKKDSGPVRREEPPGPAPGGHGRTRTLPLAAGFPRDLRRHDQLRASTPSSATRRS